MTTLFSEVLFLLRVVVVYVLLRAEIAMGLGAVRLQSLTTGIGARPEANS